MVAKSSLDLDTDPRSIIGMREFDAPRDLVFVAFTDPKHLAQWWGPNGFTTTTHSFDLRPGGVWRFVMHSPDGRDYQNRITFEEVVPPERIVYRHGGGEDVEPVQFRQTVLFEDLGGRTRMTWRATSRPRPSAIASSGNTAPLRAWCRLWHGSANMCRPILRRDRCRAPPMRTNREYSSWQKQRPRISSSHACSTRRARWCGNASASRST